MALNDGHTDAEDNGHERKQVGNVKSLKITQSKVLKCNANFRQQPLINISKAVHFP